MEVMCILGILTFKHVVSPMLVYKFYLYHHSAQVKVACRRKHSVLNVFKGSLEQQINQAGMLD
jgi:hypothetical protein